jgi:hypothetical protein
LRARILPDSEGGVPSARTSGGCVVLGAEGYCLSRIKYDGILSKGFGIMVFRADLRLIDTS